MQLILAACVIGALAPLSVSTRCPLTGPVLPRPSRLSSSSLMKSQSARLTKEISKVLSDQEAAGWDVHNTSFSLALTSVSDSKPLWEYHHLAEANTKGTKSVDGDSQYLIGSISKVFTDLLLFKSGVDPDDPVTKYLPVLLGNNTEVQWDQVTLGGLADHLSGMRQNFGFPEIYQVVPLYEALGFPKLSKADFPNCDLLGLNKACSKKQLLANLRDSHAVSPPNLRPVYSSISFTVLAYALQNATAKSFPKLLNDEIVAPLKLHNTGVSPGTTSRAVVPPGDSSWGADYGANAPGGGLYSSINDLSALIHAILNYSPTILPTTSAVRKWLLPHSVVATTSSLVGAPWEFYRSNKAGLFPTNAEPRTLTIAAKDGSAVGYSARIALLEEYGIGLSILTAGAKGATAVNVLGEALLSTFIPVVEEVMRQESQIYAGKYISSQQHATCQGTATNGEDIIPAKGKLELGIDKGPGLRLLTLQRNGSDMIDAIQQIYKSQVVYTGPLSPELRLYPAQIERISSVTLYDNKNSQHCTDMDIIEEDWRLLLEPEPIAPQRDLPNAGGSGLGVFESWCGSFQSQDSLYYGGEPIDRFVFLQRRTGEGKAGRVLGIKIPALRMVFWK